MWNVLSCQLSVFQDSGFFFFLHGSVEYTDKIQISTVLLLTPLLVMPLNSIKGKKKNEVLFFTECGRMCYYILIISEVMMNLMT